MENGLFSLEFNRRQGKTLNILIRSSILHSKSKHTHHRSRLYEFQEMQVKTCAACLTMRLSCSAPWISIDGNGKACIKNTPLNRFKQNSSHGLCKLLHRIDFHEDFFFSISSNSSTFSAFKVCHIIILLRIFCAVHISAFAEKRERPITIKWI